MLGLNRTNIRNHKNSFSFLLAVLSAGIVGVIFLSESHAKTPTISFEAESGSKSSNVVTALDGTASANSAIRFQTGSTGSQASSFPPPPGKMFFGFSEGPGSPLVDAGVNPGIDREYFQADQVSALVAYANTSASRGSLPMVSIKPQGTWQSIASGAQDGWVNSIISQLNALNRPVLWSIHHEPENDVNGTTLTAATFKAMCEHVNAMQGSNGKVKFGPTLMSGKYNPVAVPNASLRLQATDWISPNSGAYFAFDGYNHYSPGSGKKWRSVDDTFGYMVNDMRSISHTKPIVIAEYGVREDPADPNRATAWLTEAYQWSLDRNVAGMSWFSSNQNVNDGGTSWQLNGVRLTEFERLLALPSSVHTI